MRAIRQSPKCIPALRGASSNGKEHAINKLLELPLFAALLRGNFSQRLAGMDNKGQYEMNDSMPGSPPSA